MDRTSGFYWIIYEGETEWEVARWDAEEKLWYLIYGTCPAQEDELSEINETRLLPPKN